METLNPNSGARLKMTLLRIFIFLFLIPYLSYAKSITEIAPFNYEVVFTNPKCKKHFYKKPLINSYGQEIHFKTEGAYCTPSDNSALNKQKGNPHDKIIKWIKEPSTQEVFMTYLSFSKSSVIKELCKAVKTRNLKLTILIDEKNRENQKRMNKVLKLKSCINSNLDKPSTPVVLTGGHQGEGDNQTGYAHTKLILINPSSPDQVKIVFSSGNMSSGTTSHHENWHFLTTHRNTYFFQAHLCLKEGLLKHQSSKSSFITFMSDCQKQIKLPPEDDLKVFFIPGDGRKAMKSLHQEFKKSIDVKMAAHRFSNGSIIRAIKKNLERTNFQAKIIVDDDIYWTGLLQTNIGRNTLYEFEKLTMLESLGLNIKYLETFADNIENPKSIQLQHNKFLIFTREDHNGTVFTGAGNLTGAAFYKNFENFYLISIPEVHQKFLKQYDYLSSLSRSSKELPLKLELPW